MTTTVELSTSLDSLPLSGIFRASPSARVEFEPVVHQSGAAVWSFRVRDIDPAVLEEVLEVDEYVRRSRVDDTTGEQAPIEVTWELRSEAPATTTPSETTTRDKTETELGSGTDRVLLGALDEHDVIVLALSGTKRGWECTLRFPDREVAKAFQTTALNAGHSLSVTRVSDSNSDSGSDSGHFSTSIDLLTPAQCEVFTLALERGYFEIPRRTTLVDLAEEVGVSDQAVSERLRRAQAKLGRAAMSVEHPGSSSETQQQ